MAHMRGAFSKTIAPGYRRVMFLKFKERPIRGRALVNFKTADRAYFDDFPIEGFGPMSLKVEGGSVTYDEILEGTAKRYLWSTYSKAWRITEEMMDDDLYGVFGSKMAEAAGRSARNNVEVVMHSPYNNAFVNTVNGFEAGKALCDTHVSGHGVSVTNKVSGDINILTLQAGIEYFGNLVGPEGFPIMLEPKLLVHSVADQWIVAQLLKSSQLPGGNQNDINELKNMGLSGHMHHGLILDVDDWFLVADEHDVNYHQRKSLALKNSDDPDTGDAKFRGRQRHGAGYGYFHGVFGGQGT